MNFFLAGDIGGTKCELALFERKTGMYIPQSSRRYLCADFSCFGDIVRTFLDSVDWHPDLAGFGVAGPVENGVARVTNLPWVLSEAELSEELGFTKVVLVNDLTAVCASLSILEAQDVVELHPGEKKQGMKAVVAPGTGLGEGYLLDHPDLFFPRGSEGGHSSFAPVNNEQEQLLAWLKTRVEPVSYEDVIAGPGIALLYDFYVQGKGEKETGAVQDALQTVKDRTPVIVNNAISGTPCPVCQKAVSLFLSILGSEAGNLALKLYATGGVYIGGGIVPRLLGKIDLTPIVESYLQKGKMKDFVRSIPLYLVTRKDAALIGAARCCERFF